MAKKTNRKKNRKRSKRGGRKMFEKGKAEAAQHPGRASSGEEPTLDDDILQP